MDDEAEHSVLDTADLDRRRGAWVSYVAAAVVAFVSIIVWWGVRTNEVRLAEVANEQQVATEIFVLQSRLERVEEAIGKIESALNELDDPQVVVELQTTRFAQFAIIESTGSNQPKLAFSADDFELPAGLIDTESVFERQPDGRSSVSTVGESSSAVAISKPVESQIGGLNRSSTAVVALVSLTSEPLSSEVPSTSASPYLIEVDGAQLNSGAGGPGTSSDSVPKRFSVGQHQWSVKPVLVTNTASHLGSNVMWAAGVALSALVFIVLRRPEGIESSRDDLMHRFYQLTDPVTGYLNAEGVRRELDIRLRRRRRTDQVGVLLCNMDRYESIKKSFGTTMADDVIRMAFARIQGLLVGSDSCGRFGESQILVMSNGLAAVKDLEDLAEKISAEFIDPLELSDGTICHVSFAIGIALTRSAETTTPRLLADVALAQGAADRNGTGWFVFSESQRLQEEVRRGLVTELLDALSQEQLTVYYQPVVPLDTVSGVTLPAEKVEAFVRWPHPVRGMVHPGSFLPLAVEVGVDLKLTEMVLTDACRQALFWTKSSGRPISVVVNVGERQLIDLRLVGVVREVLRSTGLAAGQLELDIPEELIVGTNIETREVVQQLAQAGVRISLDDFGASSGSLQKLAATSIISTVKIDRVFVEDIATNEVNQKVISAVVSMAEQRGISVVAEGVETHHELDALHSLGVEEVQGFLFARPSPPSDILKFLTTAEGLEV